MGGIVQSVAEGIKNMEFSESTRSRSRRAPRSTTDSPVEAPASNGVAENVVPELGGQMRKMRSALVARESEVPT